MTRRTAIRIALAGACAFAGVLLLRSMGPLQWPTVFAYTGMAATVVGLAGLTAPRLVLGTPRRAVALAGIAAGLALTTASLLWPVREHRSSAASTLDTFLPIYDFEERHEIRINASPDRVMAAVRAVSFADIGVMRTLTAIRSMAMGQLQPVSPAATPQPIIALILNGRTPFFPLADHPREFIFGLAAQPWNNGARPFHLTPETFKSWALPNHVKVATNLRVDDEGNGWSRVTTETRVRATDDTARRTMARYWRLIYPGSALTRESMLEAIRARASN